MMFPANDLRKMMCRVRVDPATVWGTQARTTALANPE
jgi:hypothetical protein